MIVLRDQEEFSGYLKAAIGTEGSSLHTHGSRLVLACEHVVYSPSEKNKKNKKRMILR